MVPGDVIGAPEGWAQRLIERARELHSPWVGTLDGERLQPLFGYWSASLLPTIGRALDAGNLRVMRLIEPWRESALTLPAGYRLLNLNSPQALTAIPAD